MSIDHSSITITTDPAGVYVPYSISGEKDEDGNPTGGTVATYEIPDETAVTIEYRAMVVGTGTVTYKNTVEARGKKKDVKETVDMGSSGGGEATQFSVKAVKVDGYDANKKLQGVAYTLKIILSMAKTGKFLKQMKTAYLISVMKSTDSRWLKMRSITWKSRKRHPIISL